MHYSPKVESKHFFKTKNGDESARKISKSEFHDN